MGWFSDTFGGDLGAATDNMFGANGLQGIIDPFNYSDNIMDMLSGNSNDATDMYNKMIEEQKKLLEQQRLDKAAQTMRTDVKASSMAKNLMQDTLYKSPDMTTDIMGL